ncbi:hypothetical protein Agub_g10169, partial [Astrephomene gubernaculifera]
NCFVMALKSTNPSLMVPAGVASRAHTLTPGVRYNVRPDDVLRFGRLSCRVRCGPQEGAAQEAAAAAVAVPRLTGGGGVYLGYPHQQGVQQQGQEYQEQWRQQQQQQQQDGHPSPQQQQLLLMQQGGQPPQAGLTWEQQPRPPQGWPQQQQQLPYQQGQQGHVSGQIADGMGYVLGGLPPLSAGHVGGAAAAGSCLARPLVPPTQEVFGLPSPQQDPAPNSASNPPPSSSGLQTRPPQQHSSPPPQQQQHVQLVFLSPQGAVVGLAHAQGQAAVPPGSGGSM